MFNLAKDSTQQYGIQIQSLASNLSHFDKIFDKAKVRVMMFQIKIRKTDFSSPRIYS